MEQNREKIILQQLHRERQRAMLHVRKAMREMGQHQLGTIRIKSPKRKTPEKLDEMEMNALQEVDVADEVLFKESSQNSLMQ